MLVCKEKLKTKTNKKEGEEGKESGEGEESGGESDDDETRRAETCS